VVGTGERVSRILLDTLLDTGELDGEDMVSLSPKDDEVIDQVAVSSSGISSIYSDAPSNRSSSEWCDERYETKLLALLVFRLRGLPSPL
jgi:hypothetical protein